MSKVILGRTGIEASRSAFGALPIQRVPGKEAVKILRKAWEAGITFFDTARVYSDSEEKIGQALADVRRSIVIATKTFAATPEDFRRDLETSLTLLKTDYIDIYQFHNPAFCPQPGDGTGMYEAMLEAKEQGKIRYIGISNHRLPVAEEAVASGLYDTLQFPFNYLASDRDMALVELCRQSNMGFIAMKALSGGLLTNAAACAAWLAQFDHVLPIWGIQREAELDEFLRFEQSPPVLTEALDAVIARDREELSGNFCRACGYCLPSCPAGIQISTCARMSQLIRRSPSARLLDESGQAMMAKVESCTSCGICRGKCPYGLDVPVLLREHLADYRNILAGKTAV